MMQITGTLPVAMTVLDGQQVHRLTEVVMTQLTVGESLKSIQGMQPSQYVAVGELAAMLKLVRRDGDDEYLHPVTYDMLDGTSVQNWEALQKLRQELDAKERQAGPV